MYYSHWGLTRSPFAGGGSALFYRGESQAEALARLRYAVDEGRQAILVGPPGVGRTTLIAEFAGARRRQGGSAALVNVASVSPRELLWKISAEASLGPRPEDDVLRLIRRLEDVAAASVINRERLPLFLDDMDLAGPDARLQLMRLWQLSGRNGRWATFVFVASDDGAPRLGAELLEAVELRIELEPWSEADMVGYIQHALVAAGRDEPAFDDEALSIMYSLTGGIPRRVNRLADHALLGAAAEGSDAVNAAMIEAAHESLGWTATTTS
jgi:general secretion pathway protein A